MLNCPKPGMAIYAAALLVLLSACGTNSQTSTIAAALTPYQTLTPSPTVTLEMGSLPGETFLPSPTPFTYIIQAGDTMGALAQKFGVSLNALIAANPNVSPNAMTIGAVLLIPTDKNNPTGESTPTAVPFLVTQVDCHPTLEGGMWCFLLVQNDTTESLENVSAQISLISPDAGLVGSQVAIPPLNVIQLKTALPLTAFFPPPVPVEVTPRVQILSATALKADDTRYLNASMVDLKTEIAPGGRTANISGGVTLTGESRPAQIVWVVAVAYNATGNVVGFRRWEGGGLQPGGSLPFALTVASLGDPMVRVELFVEARP